MQANTLMTELVESLQQLQRKDKPLFDIVSNLQSATLPAIIEYGCLRWNRPEQFPALSNSVVKTPLACALSEVRSDVGLRADGHEKPPVRSLEPREAEFHTLQQEIGLNDDVEWLNFEQRFERAAQFVGFSRTAAANLHSALFEMAENAILHSQTPVAPLVGYQVASGIAMFVVADVGIGVLASLKTNPKYAELQSDVAARRTNFPDETLEITTSAIYEEFMASDLTQSKYPKVISDLLAGVAHAFNIPLPGLIEASRTK